MGQVTPLLVPFAFSRQTRELVEDKSTLATNVMSDDHYTLQWHARLAIKGFAQYVCSVGGNYGAGVCVAIVQIGYLNCPPVETQLKSL